MIKLTRRGEIGLCLCFSCSCCARGRKRSIRKVTTGPILEKLSSGLVICVLLIKWRLKPSLELPTVRSAARPVCVATTINESSGIRVLKQRRS